MVTNNMKYPPLSPVKGGGKTNSEVVQITPSGNGASNATTDTYVPRLEAKGPVLDPGMLGPTDQRLKAVAITASCPQGSVGRAINPLLTGATAALCAAGGSIHPLLTRAGCDFAAGKVGDFYESQRDLLSKPATDENIEEFTRRETEFFKTQGSPAKEVGGLLSAEDRATLVKWSAGIQKLLP